MKNNTLNNAFPIVAAALGNKFGVNVSIGGSDAFTNGKSINLPAYDSNDSNYKNVAWGYLAHEAAHLRYTNFSDVGNSATSEIRKSLVNIIEDIRIERLMQETYPGTKRTIESVISHLAETGGFAVLEDKNRSAVIMAQFVLLRLRHDVLGQTALLPLADKAEVLLEETFPAGAVTRLFGLLDEVPGHQSTRDAILLTDRILRMVQEEKEKEEEKARQQQKQQKSDDQDSSSDQDQNQTQSSQQGNAGDDDHANPGEDQDAGKMAQALSDVLSAGQDDVPEDLFEIVKEFLGSQPQNNYDSNVQMPLAFDPRRNQGIGDQIVKKVLSESGKMRASLQGLVQASRTNRTIHKRSGNRIDGRKLARLSQGDARVFQRSTQKQAPNTAFHLLLDGSGSMRGVISPNSLTRLIDVATEASVALALALEGISGVNPAITRFPHGNTNDVTPLLKHGQKVRQNTSAFSMCTDGGTPMHTALWYAAASLLATREDRKIIMVLTDGDPDDFRLAIDVIKRCESTGIEVIGVGIGTDTSRLFSKSIVINNISDLRSEIFRIGRDLLLAA